jgi:hypothetical protein
MEGSLKAMWARWWTGLFGDSPSGPSQAARILQQQYIEARQRASRLTQHAQNMPYAHFREKLLGIAAEQAKHGDQIAEKLKLFSSPLPGVAEPQLGGGNSWQLLLADLEEQRRSAAELWDQLHRVPPEFPEIAEFLQRIYEDGKKHRTEINDMLMRSDPQAFSAG